MQYPSHKRGGILHGGAATLLRWYTVFIMQKKQKYFFTLGGLGVFIGGGNWMAINLDLYFLISWLDSLMHTLSGVFITLVLLPFLPQSIRNTKVRYLLVLTFALLIGLWWEYVELKTGVTNLAKEGYLLDTTLDLFCDGAGALVGAYFFRNTAVFA
jgi:uncharacterized membrane protein YjdF